MDAKTYLRLTERTDPMDGYTDPNGIAGRLADPRNRRLLHYALGLDTESGEVADAVKRAIFYGKPLDEVNLIEEAGDLLWYLARLLDLLGVSFEDVMERNIAKLRARYPDGFSEIDAVERDLEAERRALEGGVK